MNGWLCDTNVVSEGRKLLPNANVAAFIASCPMERLFISTVNLAELRFGIELSSGVKKSEIAAWLQQVIRPMFEGRVLPITEEVMLLWRMLVHEGRKSGRTFAQPDLILAATALFYNLTFVTRNTRDFAGLGLSLVNPWEDLREP